MQNKRRYSRTSKNSKGKPLALGVTRHYRRGDVLTHKKSGEKISILKIDRSDNLPYLVLWVDTSWQGQSLCTYTFLRTNFND